jgi:hypothetical protein
MLKVNNNLQGKFLASRRAGNVADNITKAD